MRALVAVVMLGSFVACGTTHPVPVTGSRPPAATLATIGWMVGAWQGAHGAGQFREEWSAPQGGIMRGSGSGLSAAGVTEFSEQLRIEARGDGVVYIASPIGQATTEFRLTRASEHEAVFENPTHDFPTRIAYTLAADGGSLVARVDGPDGDGGVRAIEFHLGRVR